VRPVKAILLFLVLAVTFGSGGPFAGTDLNEVGAFLVYPAIIAIGPGQPAEFETFVSITNAGPEHVFAHVSYINGDEGDEEQFCYECDFAVPLTPHDTELLVINFTGVGIDIDSEDRTVDFSCNWPVGFLTVSLEDENDRTLTDNVLLGSETVVNYSFGSAFSIPAIPFQGKLGNNGDRTYLFNDIEYGKLPRLLAADFIAPDLFAPNRALLFLFTLNFDRQFSPLSECSVTGYDAAENDFSASFFFGCWGVRDLCAISPEFCYPNLGPPCVPGPGSDPNEPEVECDTHGWLKLDCRVHRLFPGPARGGVHGAIVQQASVGAVFRKNEIEARELHGVAAWGRPLYQSVTTGDPVFLRLEESAGSLE
jgi:hypothetical protein